MHVRTLLFTALISSTGDAVSTLLGISRLNSRRTEMQARLSIPGFGIGAEDNSFIRFLFWRIGTLAPFANIPIEAATYFSIALVFVKVIQKPLFSKYRVRAESVALVCAMLPLGAVLNNSLLLMGIFH